MLLSIITISPANAQREGCDNQNPQYNLPNNNVWALSDSLGLDFNPSGGPVAIQTKLHYGKFGTLGASVADSNGNLLFYTNGSSVWTANGSIMPHGQYLAGSPEIWKQLTQTCQVVQVPFQPNKYYLFTIAQYKLYVNLIDLSLNNGLGDVVDSFHLKNVPLLPSTVIATRIVAIANCSKEVWLLVHDYFASIYKAIKITATGIDTVPVVSDFSNLMPITAGYEGAGQMVVSPNGRTIAVVDDEVRPAYFVRLLDFDPASGVLSNPQIMKMGQNDYYNTNYGFASAAFSPDGSKLYARYMSGSYNSQLLQYDLNTSNSYSLIEPTNIDSSFQFPIRGHLRLGPDGKIYFGTHRRIFPNLNKYGYSAIGRINNPNLAGTACGFEDSVTTVNLQSFSFPGFFRGYFPNEVVIPQSSLNISIHFQNDTLFASPNYFHSYQWYYKDSIITGATQPFLPITDSGLYAVKVIDSNCNCSDSVTFYNENQKLGIGNPSQISSQISLYPNPTSNILNIKSPIPLQLSLFDLTGRCLMQSMGKYQLDISKLSDGFYLIKIKDHSGRFIKMEKVVKQSN